MTAIFISYRREDSAYAAHMIRGRLANDYGANSVFMDVDSIPLGVDFRRCLTEAVEKCDVLIAVIGDNWSGANPHSATRLIDNPNDFVRIEVEAALARAIPVVPVLVGKAQVPKAGDLPHSLRELVFRHAAEVRPGKDAQAHLDSLSRGIGRHYGKHERPAIRPTITPPASPVTPPVSPVPSVERAGGKGAMGWFVVAAIVAISSFVSYVSSGREPSSSPSPENSQPAAVVHVPDKAPQPKEEKPKDEKKENKPIVNERRPSNPPAPVEIEQEEPALRSVGPLYFSNPRMRITAPDQVFTTLRLTESEVESVGVRDRTEIARIIRMSHESRWPEGIRTAAARAERLMLMTRYRAHLVGNFNECCVLLWVPAIGNSSMPADMRPTTDFFMVVQKSGVELIESPGG